MVRIWCQKCIEQPRRVIMAALVGHLSGDGVTAWDFITASVLCKFVGVPLFHIREAKS